MFNDPSPCCNLLQRLESLSNRHKNCRFLFNNLSFPFCERVIVINVEPGVNCAAVTLTEICAAATEPVGD